MGGRGSSSWRDKGSDINIYSERSLVSEREGKRSETDQVLGVMRNIEKSYGITVDDLTVATLKGKSSMKCMAFYGEKRIGVNERYFDSKKCDNSMDKAAESGWHPSRGNKTGIEALTAHEAGHMVNDAAAKKMNMSMTDAAHHIVNEANASHGRYSKTLDFASQISGYATHSRAETIAEAFADVYCNGSNAKSESIAVVNVLNKYTK